MAPQPTKIVLNELGQPTREIDATVAQRIIDATRNGVPRGAAAAAGPISKGTLYNWIKRGHAEPDSSFGRFVARLDSADDEAELVAVLKWRSHFDSDWRACAEFLSRSPGTRERWKRDATIVVEQQMSLEERQASVVETFTAYLKGVEDGKAEPVKRKRVRKVRESSPTG